MRVQFSLVGHEGHHPDIWLDLPAIPREGEVVQWPGLSQAGTCVRTVVWFLTVNDDQEPIDEPFAYVVIGPRRP